MKIYKNNIRIKCKSIKIISESDEYINIITKSFSCKFYVSFTE